MSKKVIPSQILEKLVDQGIYREAEEENFELGHALKNISENDLRKLLSSPKKTRSYHKRVWERIAWSVSVAALLAVAITLPIGIENSSRNEICNLIYSYNESQIEDLVSFASRSSGEAMPDITVMSDEQLKTILPELQEAFNTAGSSQEIAITGKILAFSYIRLHKREEAREILDTMIIKLESDEDFDTTVSECRKLLKELK